MGFWDAIFGASSDPSLTDPGQEQYLRSLGQPDLSGTGVTIEGSNEPMSPAEVKQTFPSGVPSPQHSGALADLARSSSQQPPPQAQQPPPSSGRATTPPPSGQGAPGSRVWATGAAPAKAEVQHNWNQVAATGNLAHAAGTLVRMAATMGAGGGMGAGAGAGGATAGTAAGASSAAGGAAGAAGGGASSFGGGFMQGIMGGGSGGGMSSILGGTATSGDYGSMLGSLARKELASGGGGGGGGAPGTTGGTSGFNPAAVEQSSLGAGSGKMSGGVQKFIGTLDMTPEREWANQLLADTSDQMVAGSIPWAQG